MYRQLDEVMHESPWTMMFTNDMLICSEKREQVEENLEWAETSVSRDLKGKVYKTVVRPAMMDGLGTKSLT